MLNRWVGSRIPETKETNIPYTKRRKKRLWNGFQSRQHIEKVPAPQCASNRKLRFTAIFINTRDMCVGFYTKRLRTVPAGRGSGAQIRSKVWFRSRGCLENYAFRQPPHRKLCFRCIFLFVKILRCTLPEFWKTTASLCAAIGFHLMHACGAGKALRMMCYMDQRRRGRLPVSLFTSFFAPQMASPR